MHLPFPSSDTLMGLQNQEWLSNLSGVLYPTYSIVLCFSWIPTYSIVYVALYCYIFNRFMFCIPTYSIVLFFSVFLYIQSFYVALYFYIFKRFICLRISTYSIVLCSVFLHNISFYDLHLYIFNRFTLPVFLHIALYFYIFNRIMLLYISTYVLYSYILKCLTFCISMSSIEILMIKLYK